MDRFLLFPLLAPAVLLAAGNDAFGFDPPGYLDSFVYVGYFWHYPEHLWVFDDNSNYKISRLPWILPGYVLHTLAGPIVASYLLAYVTPRARRRRAVSPREGVPQRSRKRRDRQRGVGLLHVGSRQRRLELSGAHRDRLLPDGVLARGACGARALVGSRQSSWRAPFFAAAVHTHLFLVVFAPLVAVLYVVALPADDPRKLARSLRAAGVVVVGGLALTAALAVINRATGGAWLFFMPQVDQAMRVTNPDYDHWWKGALQWLPAARYLVIPVALMCAGLAVPFRRRHEEDRRMAIALVVLAWAAFGIMCYFQLAGRLTTLDYSYVAFAVYPHAFACLGAVLSDARRSAKDALVHAGIVTAVVLGTLLLLLPTPLPDVMNAMFQASALAHLWPIVTPLAVSLLGVAAMLLLRGTGRVILFAVWFSVVNAWLAPTRSSYGIATPGYQQSMLKMFYEADRLTTEIDPTLIGIKYWMSNDVLATPTGDVPLRSVFDSFLATRAWFTNLLARKSPSPPIEQLTLADLERGACIGVLSSVDRQAELQRAMEAHFAQPRSTTSRRDGPAIRRRESLVCAGRAQAGRQSGRRIGAVRATGSQSGRRATAMSEPPCTRDNCLSGASAPNRPAEQRVERLGWDGQCLSDDLDQVVRRRARSPGAIQR